MVSPIYQHANRCFFSLLVTRFLEDFTSLKALYQQQMFNYIGLILYIKYGKITSINIDDVFFS